MPVYEYQLNNKNKDFQIRFMHPYYPSRSFCPSKDDDKIVNPYYILI